MISFNKEISKFPPTLVLSGSRVGVLNNGKPKPKSQGLGAVMKHVCEGDPWDAEVEEQSSRLAWTTYGHLVSKNKQRATNKPTQKSPRCLAVSRIHCVCLLCGQKVH